MLSAPTSASAVGETADFLGPVDGVVVGGSAVLVRVAATPASVMTPNGEVVIDGGAAATGCDAANTMMMPDVFDVNLVEMSCTWDASGVTDGAHTLTAMVSDGISLVAAAPATAGGNPINVTVDNTPPSGGSVTVPSQVGPSTTVNVGYTPGTDLHEGAVYMQRADAPLSGGTCGTFGGFSTLYFIDLRAIASPFVDNSLALGNCYMYRLQEVDAAGNEAFYTSPNIVKVQSVTPPTPPQLALALTAGDGAVVSGSTVTINPTVAGSFSIVATPTSGSGTYTSVAFPDLDGAGTAVTPAGAVDAAAPFQTTYSWTPGATPAGTHTVTVTDSNAQTATATFTVATDTTAPTGGSVSAKLGTATGGTPPVVITFAPGSDPSGIQLTALQRTVGERVDGDCVRFSDFFPVQLNPTSPFTDSATAEDRCYVYRLTVTDGVGNTAIFNDSALVIVNTARAVVKGSSGNDTINGTDDAEYIALGAGNDVVRLGGGDDAANGGPGNDTIRGNLGDDCSLYGGDGEDLIFGGPGADCIYGNNGNDKLHGGSGNDTIDGGRDDDYITGGSGNDKLDGSFGKDKIGGGDGNDRIYGSYDDDLLLGHDGDDFIRGDFGNDVINGGPGDDSLGGVQGNDLIVGGDGNDKLTGLYGYDALYGGNGNDGLSDSVNLDSGPIPERYGLYGGLGRDTYNVTWNVDFLDEDTSTKLIREQLPYRQYVIDCGGGADTVTIEMYGSARNSYAPALTGQRGFSGIALRECGEATLELVDTQWMLKQCGVFFSGVGRRLGTVGIEGSAGSYKLGPSCQKKVDAINAGLR